MSSPFTHSVSDETTLMSRLWSASLRDNPLAFVMFAYPWGVKGGPLEHQKGPRKWQRRVLQEMADHLTANRGQIKPRMWRKAIASGRGIGKSALISWIAHWFVTTRIGGSVIISANGEPQLRQVTWGELSKWVAMSINSHWWDVVGIKMTPKKWLTQAVERDLKKGTRYWSCEGKLWSEENPDAYAGVHNHDGIMVLFDEGSGIPSPIWDVAQGFFTEPIVDRFWVAFSNPRRNYGYFFECFNKRRDFWLTENIDARAVEGTDHSLYETIIAEHGPDSYQAKVEVYGEFPDDGDDQFIAPALVKQATARPRYNDPDAPTVMGIDPSRGGDAAAVVIRQGRDITLIKRYRLNDTMKFAMAVCDLIDEHRPDYVFIDEGGLGYGVMDRLREEKIKVRGVNFGASARNPKVHSNKRTEIWDSLRKWLKDASLPDDRRLIDDLIGPKEEHDDAGVMKLESKKKMKSRGLSSPDTADALAVTFAYPVKGKLRANRQNESAPFSSQVSNNWMSA